MLIGLLSPVASGLWVVASGAVDKPTRDSLGLGAGPRPEQALGTSRVAGGISLLDPGRISGRLLSPKRSKRSYSFLLRRLLLLRVLHTVKVRPIRELLLADKLTITQLS